MERIWNMAKSIKLIGMHRSSIDKKKKKGGNALKLIKNAPECYKNMHAETHPNEKIVWTGPKCKPTVHLNTTISRNHQAK